MSGELTKEQLLEYVKKQKLKIKKLENEISTLKTPSEVLPIAQQTTVNFDNITAEIEQLKSELVAKDSDLLAQSQLIESLQKQLSSHLSEKQEQELLITSLQNLVSNLNDVKSRYDSAHSELVELKAQHENIALNHDMELSDLRDQLDSALQSDSLNKDIQTKLNDIQTQLFEALETEKLQLKTIEDQAKNVAELSASNEKLLQLTKDSELQITSLKAQLEQQLSSDSDAGQQLQDLIQQNEDLQQSLSLLRDQAQRDSENEEKERDVLAELEATKQRCDDLNTELDETKQQIGALTVQCAEKDSALVSQSIELQTAKDAVTDATQDQSVQALELARLNKELDSLQSTVDSLTADLKASHDQSAELLSQLEESRRLAVEAAANATATAVSVANTASSPSASAEAAHSVTLLSTTTTTSASSSSVATSKKKKNNKKNKNSTAVTNNSADSTAVAAEEESEAAEVVVVSSHSEHTSSSVTTACHCVEHSAARSAHSDEIASLNAQLNEIRTQLTEAQGECALLSDKLHQLEAEKVDSERNSAALAEDLREAQLRLSGLGEESADKDEQIAQLRVDLKEITDQFNGCAASEDDTVAIYEAQLVTLHAQVAQLQSEVAAKQSEFETLSSQASESATVLEAANEAHSSAQQQLASILKQQETNNLKGDDAIQSLQLSVNALEEQLGAARGEKDVLQTRLRAEVDEVTGKLNAAVQSLMDAKEQLDVKTRSVAAIEEQLESERLTTEATQADLLAASQLTKQLQTELSAAQTKVADLEALVSSLQEGTESSVGVLQTQLASLQATLNVTQEELRLLQEQSAQSLSTTSSELSEAKQLLQTEMAAHEETKTALAASESTGKKLKAHLKVKMKELADATASLNELQSSKVADSSANDSNAAKLYQLTTQLADCKEALQKAEQQLAAEKSAHEAKLKCLKDVNNSNEEKISSLLREKNALQEELFSINYKTEFASKELKAAVDDRDQLRTRLLETETRLSSSESSHKESLSALTHQLKGSAAKAEELGVEMAKLKDLNAKANAEALKYRDLEPRYMTLQNEHKVANETQESLREQLRKEQTDGAAREAALTDKLKRLKALLNKVNNASQEKDSKMNSLLSLTERPKRFHMVARIQNVSSATYNSSNPEAGSVFCADWCLILEDSPPGGTESPSPAGSSKYRWVEKSTVDTWMTEGSKVVNEWPVALDEQWSTLLSSTKHQLQSERDELKEQLEDVSNQFQTYKVRAQTALKRIGNEERNEKQRQQDALLSNEIERLTAELVETAERENELEAKLATAEGAIAGKDTAVAELQVLISSLENSVREKSAALAAAERRVRQLESEVESVTQQCGEANLLLEKSNKQLADIMQLKESFELQSSAPCTPAPSSQANTDVASLRRSDSGVSASENQKLTTKVSDRDLRSHPSSDKLELSTVSSDTAGTDTDERRNQSTQLSPETRVAVNDRLSPRSSPQKTKLTVHIPAHEMLLSPKTGSTDGLMLHQQAEHSMRDSLVLLRTENSQLSIEIIELKSDIGLRDDQITALKDTIRELEATIMREREFNAGNRRINADYLVNVLRKFLMSTNPSERAKLVPVLCIILQFQQDETRVITEKWAVRTGGLVGWLMPPKLDESHSSNGLLSPRGGAAAESMKMNRGGDVTYDPVTGGGIDINTY